jgi:PAS domain S-box-containing protein
MKREAIPYQAFFEESLSAMLVIDPATGQIVDANAAACRFYGYCAEQLTSMCISEINSLGGAALAAAMADAQAQHTNYFRFRHRLASGAIRDVDVYSSPMLVGDRRLLASVIHDVTEHCQTQEALEQAMAAEHAARVTAEQALRVADAFLATAAHELKTPLTSLRGFSQTLLMLAERNRLDAERSRRALQGMAAQTERFAQLVDRLFDLSLIETGRLVLQPAPTDLGSLCATIVTAAQACTTIHAITLRAPSRAWAQADTRYIEQVLRHLVENAIKFSPEGGPITVSVLEPDTNTVGVAVRDRGLGVPVERRTAIFDRLGQAHADSYRSGLGLGLYIGRQIVELHGGRLEVEFPEEGGSIFTVLLPRATMPAIQAR